MQQGPTISKPNEFFDQAGSSETTSLGAKLHLGVDEKTKEIVAVDLTNSGVHNGEGAGVRNHVSGDRDTSDNRRPG